MKLLKRFKFRQKISNKTFGNIGEDIAESFLKSHKYKIIARNYRCKSGEIDIIAQLNDIVCFVEVKTRSSNNFGAPEEAVTNTKQNHISKVAKYYISQNRLTDTSFRADIVSIILNNDTPEIKHIIDAFPLR